MSSEILRAGGRSVTPCALAFSLFLILFILFFLRLHRLNSKIFSLPITSTTKVLIGAYGCLPLPWGCRVFSTSGYPGPLPLHIIAFGASYLTV